MTVPLEKDFILIFDNDNRLHINKRYKKGVHPKVYTL
jgi:hypothetical protein